MNAIGLIEVVGYVAAIEACDACVKSANVNILSIDKVGAGIVTLSIVGDVGAVKSAIEAGEVAANKVGILRSTHVIPRVHKEVADGLLKKENQKTTQKYIKVDESSITEEIEEEDKRIEEIQEIKEIKEENLNIEKISEEEKKETEKKALEEVEVSDEINNDENRNLLNMNVKELKTLAKKLDPSLTSKNLNSLRKEDLVDLVDRLIKGDK